MIVPKVKYEVVDEGIRLGHEDALVAKNALQEGWIKVEKLTPDLADKARRLAKDQNISTSDAETLLLARQRQVEAFLVDEKPLSNLAKMYGLKVWNTWIILLEALAKGLIEDSDIQAAINELGKKRHKLKTEQAKEILDAAKRIIFIRNKVAQASELD